MRRKERAQRGPPIWIALRWCVLIISGVSKEEEEEEGGDWEEEEEEEGVEEEEDKEGEVDDSRSI